MGLVSVPVLKPCFMYGQKKDPKDVKTQPQEEFITQTNHDLEQAKEETAALNSNEPSKIHSAGNNITAREIDEEGLEIKQSDEQPQNGKGVQTEEKAKNTRIQDINH
jgi:hypothetical protein